MGTTLQKYCAERYERYGVENLDAPELLSVALQISLVSAIALSKKIGDNQRDYCTIAEIGKAKAKQIEAILELTKIVMRENIPANSAVNNSRLIYLEYKYLASEQKEKFFALILDSKNRIIKRELVSIGSLNFSIVHPREVFAPAIQNHAASIILVHNHPGGDPVPSQDDISVTRRLVEVGKLVGIEVLDHIIIGNDCYVSFLEQKLI